MTMKAKINTKLSNSRVWIPGHSGLVGSSLIKRLEKENCEIIKISKSRLNLLDRSSIDNFLKKERIDQVFVCAAKVGGILANSKFPADFIRENLTISLNIIDSSHFHDVNNLIFLGSSCIYPKKSKQPIKEEYLLTGPLEPTNEPYSIAKIAGIKLCEYYKKQYKRNYFSVQPTNLYGPFDNFDLETSHVLPALIRKIHEAKVSNSNEIILWGSGKPKREFLFSDDLADCLVFLSQRENDFNLINIGSGEEISILNLAKLICDVISYKGHITFDLSKPDGMMRKKLSLNKIHFLGWENQTNLKEGIKKTYNWFINKNLS
jgi:GDP-L-fucose synthase